MKMPNRAKFGGFNSEFHSHQNRTGYGFIKEGETLYFERTWGSHNNDAAIIIFDNKNQVQILSDKFKRLFNYD